MAAQSNTPSWGGNESSERGAATLLLTGQQAQFRPLKLQRRPLSWCRCLPGQCSTHALEAHFLCMSDAMVTELARHSMRLPILIAVLTIAPTGCMQTGSEPQFGSVAQEMQGGTILSGTEIRRSGVVEIPGCTGTVLYSSAFHSHSWVLTAAHCVCDIVGRGNPVGNVRWPDSSANISTQGTPFIPSGFPSDAACSAQMHPNDIALVRFPKSIPIVALDGSLIDEHRRPVWQVHPPIPSGAPNILYRSYAVLGAGKISGAPTIEECDSVGNNDATLRWARSWFGPPDSSGNVGQMETLHPAGTWLRNGDSGAGYFTTPGGANPTVATTIEHGAVLAVHSGGNCGGIQSAWGAATFFASNFAFLSATMGADLTAITADYARGTCDSNWCAYDDEQKASLLVAAGTI